MEPRIEALLKSLEKTREDFWNIPPETGQFINQVIRDRKYKTVFEIGTSNGYSGIWIAEALSHTNGKLYTIESHAKKRFGLATENFKKSGLSKHIVQILGHAPEAIPKNPEKFDMAFFDATKGEHIDYWKEISPRIKKGGIIITDNINSHKDDFVEYLKFIEKNKQFKSKILNIGSGVLLSEKL